MSYVLTAQLEWSNGCISLPRGGRDGDVPVRAGLKFIYLVDVPVLPFVNKSPFIIDIKLSSFYWKNAKRPWSCFLGSCTFGICRLLARLEPSRSWRFEISHVSTPDVFNATSGVSTGAAESKNYFFMVIYLCHCVWFCVNLQVSRRFTVICKYFVEILRLLPLLFFYHFYHFMPTFPW